MRKWDFDSARAPGAQSPSRPLAAALLPLLLLVGADSAPGQQQRVVEARMTWIVTTTGRPSRVVLTAVIPRSWHGRQQVLSMEFSPSPARIHYERGARYATWVLVDPGPAAKIEARVRLRLSGFDLRRASAPVDRLVLRNRTRWLASEKYLEVSHPRIQQVTRSLRADEPLETVHRIYSWVLGHMRHGGYRAESIGALKALDLGLGDCSDYVDLMVALCRAAGIPARAVYGFATSWRDTPRHAWIEVFLPRKGWVSFDPLAGDLRRGVFGRFPPRYVHLSAVRNDPRINSFYYYSWRTRGGVAKIADGFQLREIGPVTSPR